MAKNSELKKEALRLRQAGMAVSKIAAILKVSSRTIQRWIKDESPVKVKVVAMKADKDVSNNVAKDVVTSDEFDLSLSRRMAIRLVNLSEAALDAVEDCLNDPDARRADKLRAASMIVDWLGLRNTFVTPVQGRVEKCLKVQLTPPKPRPSLSLFPFIDDEDE